MSEDLVTVAQYRFAPKAEMARALLEEQGIVAFADNVEVGNTIGLLGGAAGFVKLQVPADQEKAASALLHEHAASLDDDDPENDVAAHDPVTRCLSCGAALKENDDVCPNCGWTYDVPAAGDDV